MEIINGTEITYLYAQGQPFAMHNNSEGNINYLHLDYQGSIMSITHENGSIIDERNVVYAERSRSNVWGRERDAIKLFNLPYNPWGGRIRRGFTFHEHLEEFNLINMSRLLSGGRAYDPLLARFLNADPLLQDNTDAQNYNRYSYVLNNPTKYTDPTGYVYNNYDLQQKIQAESERMINQELQFSVEENYQRAKEMVECQAFQRGGGSGNNPNDDGYGRLLTEAEKAAHVAKYGGIAPNSEFVVTSGVPNYSSRWSAGNTGAMQARNGDYSPYYQNQGKYTGKADDYLISSDVGNIIGMKSTIWGGSASWTGAEMIKDGFLKVGSKAVKFGNWAGGAGLAISGYNFSVKYINKKENTSDWVDLAASGGLVWAGIAVTAPVAVGAVVVIGIGYGVYRIGWGENADAWINGNFGYNHKK